MKDIMKSLKYLKLNRDYYFKYIGLTNTKNKNGQKFKVK